MTTADLTNPILNSPYDPPEAHFGLGPAAPMAVVAPWPRPSELFIPVPPRKKGRRDGEQGVVDFDATEERGVKVINDYDDEVVKAFAV